MVYVADKKLIIEIEAGSPLQDLSMFKTALSVILESVDTENQRDDLLENLKVYTQLMRAFNISPDQLNAIDRVISGFDNGGKGLREIFKQPAA